MKSDITASVGAAVMGVLMAFFSCKLFMGPIKDVKFKTVERVVETKLTEPDKDAFNFRALDPTVEVFVGRCKEVDEEGNCLSEEEVEKRRLEEEEKKEEEKKKLEEEERNKENKENKEEQKEQGQKETGES